jgi:hypothetical protein
MGGISIGSGGTGSPNGGGGGFDQMCFPVSKRTQNKRCCDLYGGGNCGGQQQPPVPANPAPPGQITPAVSAGGDANLVFTQSAYGGVIPILFGSDLISGNIIWATPFVKHTYTDGTTQKFYYSVSLAIALCEGPLDHMLRLYVADQLVLDNTTEVDQDGVPVKSADGVVSSLSVDLTSPTSPLVKLAPSQRKTKITIYDGGPYQTPPQAMIAQEGYDYTPAYRGIAYLLIENFLVTDSVPSLAVEVSANTVSLFPRLTADMSADSASFPTDSFRGLMYLPGYNVYMRSVYSANAPTIGNPNSYIVLDGNTLETEKYSDKTFSITDPDFSDLMACDYGRMLTSGNILLVSGNTSGGHAFGTWSPFYDALIDWTGGGGTNGIHSSNGPASSQDGVVIARGLDANNNLCDIILCPSFPIDNGQPRIAFLTVTDDGRIEYPFFTNGTKTMLSGQAAIWGGSCQGVLITYNQDFANDTPNFADGGATLGMHAYYFTTRSDNTNLYVDRIDFDIQSDGTSSVTNPRVVATDVIGIGDLFGSRVNIVKAFRCPSDNTCIVCCGVSGAEGQGDSLIFKYDPINVRIVWKAFVNTGSSFTASNYLDLSVVDDVSNDKWAWVDATGNSVWGIDLNDGTVTEIFDISDQGINWPSSGIGTVAQMYNGREDAILFPGNTTKNVLQKVFLSRANRATVPLSTIITKLLNRVDWRTADIDIQGLDTLAVNGYTINSSGYTLRQAFNELQQVFTFDIVESNGDIAYKQRGNAAVATVSETKLQDSGDTGQPWLKETHEYDLAGARKLSVTYRDVDREYKSNVQSIQLPKYDDAIIDADAAIDVQVPIVLDATTAKKLAEILLYAKITYQAGFEGALPYGAMQYDPSDVLTFQFNPADNLPDISIRLRQTSIGADHSFAFTGAREDPDIYTDQINLFGTLGRYTPQTLPTPPDRVDFTPLEVPFWDEVTAAANDTRANSYPVYMTLTSLRKGAKLPTDNIIIKDDAGDQFAVPSLQHFPTWGFVQGTLSDWPEYYTTDFKTTLTVKMLSTAGATLGSCTDYYDMLNTRTKCLAIVGDEVVQFQTATNLGDDVWEFSVLRRGLFGTELAISAHKNGDRFVLLWGSDGLFDARGLKQVNLELDDGEDKFLTFSMPNSQNIDQPDLTTNYRCRQFKPYIPSAGQINYSGDDAVVSWKRRSRYNGQWTDSGDESGDAAFTDGSPLISVPTFDLYLTKNTTTFNSADITTYLRKVTVTDALTFTYTSAMQAEDGFTNTADTLYAYVLQTVNKTGLDSGDALLFSRGPKQ